MRKLVHPTLFGIALPALVTLCIALGVLAIGCSGGNNSPSPPIPPPPPPSVVGTKELFIPSNVWLVPQGNDFNSPNSEYSHHRRATSENFAIYWAREYGTDPSKNTDARLRFNAQEILKECERFYDAYVNDFKFVLSGQSVAEKHKIIIWVIDSNEGAAFGGGSGDVGMLWCPAGRINAYPYCAAAHELAHAFQHILRQDGYTGFNGGFNEMQAQWFLWNVYPEWMTLENYHLVELMKKTHFAFMHDTNIYHDPYVLEYWTNLYGVAFMGHLTREAREGEDPAMAYKRVNGLTQDQFNDDIYCANARFITWDLDRVQEHAKPYRNQHTTALDDIGGSWYRIAPEKHPQNYGYNGIQLDIPAARSTVSLEFYGLVGAEGQSAVNTEKAGWRYGFVAYKNDGQRVYSPAYSDAEGRAEFTVPEGTSHLWLVVMGAPSEHWANPVGGPDTQWPYKFKISGTKPVDAIVNR